MARLEIAPSSAFRRDMKRLQRRHVDLAPLNEVLALIAENSESSLQTLRQRHDMHDLTGGWRGSVECHVCNAGDWLLVWQEDGVSAVIQRTGTHDEVFRDARK